MMNSHQRAFDARLEHRAAGLAALTADTTLADVDQRSQVRTEFVTVMRLESVKISANNEFYNVYFEVSNDDFTTVEVAAICSLGATEARLGGAVDNAAGDEYHVHWCTEVNGTNYQSWRIRLDVGGTSPSIAFSMNSTK